MKRWRFVAEGESTSYDAEAVLDGNQCELTVVGGASWSVVETKTFGTTSEAFAYFISTYKSEGRFKLVGKTTE